MAPLRPLPLLLLLSATLSGVLTLSEPSMKFSRTMPLHVYEGEDVLITCVVQDIGDNVVMWRKQVMGERTVELTAGDTRVTPDKRIDVLHDPKPDHSQEVTSRGDVWVLVIRDAVAADSGVYVCEVNSNPGVRSFHSVTVYPKDLQPPVVDEGGGGGGGEIHTPMGTSPEPLQYEGDEEGGRTFSSRSHNYTDCCVSLNVSLTCLGFCSIQNIIEGNTGQGPENCEQDFPAIVRCMADGRNHVPCCIQERVPDICQDVCRGEYTAITDNIKTHFSCSAYTEQTLACIVEGIELLPSPPLSVQVRPLTERSLNISWAPPLENPDTLQNYIINVTALRSFDDRPLTEAADAATPLRNATGGAAVWGKGANTTHYGVSARRRWLALGALRPFTVYDISVVAQNSHGTSMPSYTVRTMTLAPGAVQPAKGTMPSDAEDAPKLPDVRACCVRKGVGQQTCLERLCDPARAAETEVTDLMICAPWAADTFNCLADGRDHTPCCRARGLPAPCHRLCTGNVSTIDFSYFKCLRYMGEYTNCLLQGYGVLPGPPLAPRVTNVETEFAIVQWTAPERLPATVLHYRLHYRALSPVDDDAVDLDLDPADPAAAVAAAAADAAGDDGGGGGGGDGGEGEYETVAPVHSPYVLEGLDSDTDYEVYVEAVNAHGVGEPSNRITFRTESQVYSNQPGLRVDTGNSWGSGRRSLVPSALEGVAEANPQHVITDKCLRMASRLHKAVMEDLHADCQNEYRQLRELIDKVEEDRLERAEEDAAAAAGNAGYNVTACCVEADLRSGCLPLCSYSASMTAVRRLAGVCAPELHRLLRCGAGGRDHGACCARRGVPQACAPLCAGLLHGSPLHIATNCVAYIGNVVQCFEEGTEILPGPASELHATVLDETSILVEWDPPTDGANVSDYLVQYQKFDNTSIYDVAYRLQNQINVTENSVILKNLEMNATYHILVLSRNEHGTSLPSSVIVIHLVKPEGEKGEKVNGVPTPPHSLAVLRHSATWVTVTWQPPEFSHPSEKITYRLHYKFTSEEKYHVMNTTITSYMLMDLTPNTQYIVYVVALSAKGESVPSETLIAWTDPAYPAFVEPPTVHPINLVVENGSMTILCIAMGTPLPTISLYVSGRLVRQETTRHMVTVIHNVTRDMDQISCYADNGYGTPMQASRKITINHKPHIQASGITMASAGETVTLECRVEARPAPKMIFWRSPEDRTAVIQGGNFDIRTTPARDQPDRYVMQLTIKQVTEVDAGDYFCHAENAIGWETKAVSVRVRTVAPATNVTQCCLEQNVTAGCMDACSFYLDIDVVIDRPECLQDFDKLMKCAADGSDHRECCTGLGVPRRCLDWCRGEPVLSGGACVLAHTKQIMTCFHQGREQLPGPPRRVRVEFEDAQSVRVQWEPPVKNPHTVRMYRVFWRDVQDPTKKTRMVDTPETHVRITGLKDGRTYDAFVKAGNAKGTSTLTEPVTFTMSDGHITSAAAVSRGEGGGDGGGAGVAVAVVLALAVVAAVVAGAVWLVRTRRMLGVKGSGGVAFENPSYLREVNMDHIQVPNGQTETSVSNSGSGGGAAANGIAVSSSSGGQGWKNEALHVPATAATEVNPTLYEELKLGQDGAGFRRLKP